MNENKLFEVLLDVIPFGAYAVDIETFEVVYANKIMTEKMHAPNETFCWNKIFGQEEICSWCSIAKLKHTKKKINEKLITIFFNEATDCWLQSYDELVTWPDGRTVKYSLAVDITEQKEIQASMIRAHTKLAIQTKKLSEANKKLDFMSKRDYLTGINNRGNFFHLGNQILHQNTENDDLIFIAMFDLDKFKRLNDNYGHKTGDLAIKTFASIVESNLDEGDIFGRLGGEEFALIMNSRNQNDVLNKLEKIRNDTRNITIKKDTEDVTFTVSIGLAQKQANDTLDLLLDRADQQLYAAKSDGRNRIKFRGL